MDEVTRLDVSCPEHLKKDIYVIHKRNRTLWNTARYMLIQRDEITHMQIWLKEQEINLLTRIII